MTAEIYYFSGTGNSLAVAREIAKGLRGQLLSIPAAVRKGRVELKGECIGIVFPAYVTSHANPAGFCTLFWTARTFDPFN
jgi:flavodoxin